eukprot:CAMPEP_0171102504 /NCGR_PEP_ID=MMETSP0766_2-20121228/58011_1 /TAXON_ID=439317 /ORGANISM="Gambierdiscus australes, Strain CAWD 149" /LENGTH=385 /DNA_ID=CAMNT_0011562819 /DNA_START=1 /DNA_END=1158 /DNA_ORIENTATION=-
MALHLILTRSDEKAAMEGIWASQEQTTVSEDVATEESQSSDDGQSLSSDASESTEKRQRIPARTCGATLVLGSLLATVVGSTLVASCRPLAGPLEAKSVSSVPALQLFLGSELAEVTTENLMKLGSSELSLEDRDEVRQHVDACFRNVSAMLETTFPRTWAQLSQVHLTVPQQKALMTAMKALSDLRVQRLGRDMALTMRSVFVDSGDSRVLKRRLLASLGRRLSDIQRLRNDVMPGPLHGDDDGTTPLEVALNPERLSFMGSFHKWSLEISISPPQPEARRLKAGFIELGLGAIAHAKKFFEHIQAMASKALAGSNLSVVIDSLKNVDVSNLMHCAMSAIVGARLMGAMQCGVEFAEAAMDVLRAISGQPTSKSIRRPTNERRL